MQRYQYYIYSPLCICALFDLTTVRKLYLNTKPNLVMLIYLSFSFSLKKNSNNGVLGIVLASSAVDHGLGHPSRQTKDIGICCFLANHAALNSKNKAWLVRILQANVSEWSDTSTRGMLFQ